MSQKTNTVQPIERRLIPAGPGGQGGWSCHTFEDGETFPTLCAADDCPTALKKAKRERYGDVIGW